MAEKDEHDKRDRQMIELLNELRIALPGVQILFGFLLTVPFSQGFQKTTPTQKGLLYATLLATAASTICLIAPSATHRLRFHANDRAYVIESANKLLLVGLGFLAIALITGLTLITDYIYDGAIVVVGPATMAVALLVLWFVRPLVRRARGLSSGP